MKFRLDIPYPLLENINPDKQVATMLLNHLGGLHSKMSSLSFYLYCSTITYQTSQELHNVFDYLCQVEMDHLKLFSKLVYLLQEDPRLWNYENELLQYWSAGYNIYPLDTHLILEHAITLEKHMIELSLKHFHKIQQENIKNLLQRIIQEDKLHVELLEYYLNKLK